MDDVISLVMSTLVLLSSMVTQPQRASCPRSWVIGTGVRGGVFMCQPDRIGCDYLDRVCEQPPGFVIGRVYCGPGLEPALTRYADGVRCQRQPRT
ncbi:MAG TPA: hypothetical protein VMZ53_03675 [Kofleriaceae bacterium]|nr:hypothetical protein [Kofleriaceae bacterium]